MIIMDLVSKKKFLDVSDINHQSIIEKIFITAPVTYKRPTNMTAPERYKRPTKS